MLDYPKKYLEWLGFFIVFLVVSSGVVLSNQNFKYYNTFLMAKNGPVESLTSVAFIIGVVLGFYRSKILGPFRKSSFVLGLHSISCLYLIGFLDEINYGQRLWQFLFDFEVPIFFKKYNIFGEMNFHYIQVNILNRSFFIFDFFIYFFLFSYFGVFPLIYKRADKIKEIIDFYAIPVARSYHFISLLFLLLLFFSIKGIQSSDFLEFICVSLVLLVMFEPLNREVFSRKSFER